MKTLVLGGTRFVGRAIVQALIGSGHDVTLFNRGRSDPGAFPNIEHLTGDRAAADVSALRGRRWDAVIDVSGYRPDDIRPVLDALGGDAVEYLYISTVSVYRDPISPGAAEDAPLWDDDEQSAADSRSPYGAFKALCERLLRDVLPERLTVLRPTVVIGPHDTTDRFTWWVRRAAAGGRMPVPSRMTQPVQLVDADDLAAFAARLLQRQQRGTYNVVGPAAATTLAGMLTSVQSAVGSSAEVVEVPVERAAGTMPLVLPPDGSDDGAFSVSNAAAVAHGLQLRPLSDSARAVHEWDAARGLPPLRAGPDAADEERLLSGVA